MILINIKFVNLNHDDTVKQYNNYIDANNFSKHICQNCKTRGRFSRNTSYNRGYVYRENDEVIETTINITVVQCEACEKYHALLPAFIFPYHIYSASFILMALEMKLIKQENLIKLLTYLNISPQLLYYWLRVFNKFIPSSSVILSSSLTDNVSLLEHILNDIETFISKFFSDLCVMFFLNRNNHLFK